ncbi:DUF1643 domain-containing protein [Mesorhizobium sp. M2A.F.Ca.ET.039.01.1.1]|uniref:DUF1643 domain-containing protein n=1 Tax=Mesorhizobium sp. M2A.F.Ca.ET.039.01.1.1 TaxID=2496746 RepID=UPI000FC9AAC4|nr:DUF1643 domain-containing protein [Mesorhizobium sp. M2A.F.Ca.ET.039.01.1.1]RWX72513.1 DUF1643 domain-containing protein [Mesorhizobium sp. M2A.F.Ca.ET.039.01.1.1]
MSADLHDPGGKTRWPIPADMEGQAFFSGDGKRRTILARRKLGYGWTPFALWIGMNPSTADASVDDPTVRREWLYTYNRLGLYAYVKANVMDYRATDPAALLDPDIFPCSPVNRETIRRYAMDAEVIVAAWGALPDRLRVHATAVKAILREVGKPVFCLALAQDGSPRHGRGVKLGPLVPFDVGAGDA